MAGLGENGGLAGLAKTACFQRFILFILPRPSLLYPYSACIVPSSIHPLFLLFQIKKRPRGTTMHYDKALENFMQSHGKEVTVTKELDDSLRFDMVNVSLHITVSETTKTLTIKDIQVVEFLQRTGLGIGTRLIEGLIEFALGHHLQLDATNVLPAAYGFWQQPALGFVRVYGSNDHWHCSRTTENLCLMDRTTNRRYG